MRFASLQSSNTGDYAAAGKAAADTAVNVFATQRKSGPDYGKLSQIAMVTNTKEKIASMAKGHKSKDSSPETPRKRWGKIDWILY